jgi:hypothetical protein
MASRDGLESAGGPLLNGFKNTLTLFGTCSISIIEHVQNTLNYDIDQEG